MGKEGVSRSYLLGWRYGRAWRYVVVGLDWRCYILRRLGWYINGLRVEVNDVIVRISGSDSHQGYSAVVPTVVKNKDVLTES